MLFSLNYKSPHKQEADEIRCPINQLGTVLNFIKANPNKRYNIAINKDYPDRIEKAIGQINIIKSIVEDYTIRCEYIPHFKELINKGYNAYLRFPVADWESFNNLDQNGATDIYIDGPLGFQYDVLKSQKNNRKIRVSPTISPNAALSTSSNINSFFIRPEDLHLYNKVIDVIDFNEPNQEKEDTLFSIYKRGTFNFDLKELIPALNASVPNLFIGDTFGQNRLNCGQRCKIPGCSCHICETQQKITNKIISYLNKSN